MGRHSLPKPRPKPRPDTKTAYGLAAFVANLLRFICNLCYVLTDLL